MVPVVSPCVQSSMFHVPCHLSVWRMLSCRACPDPTLPWMRGLAHIMAMCTSPHCGPCDVKPCAEPRYAHGRCDVCMARRRVCVACGSAFCDLRSVALLCCGGAQDFRSYYTVISRVNAHCHKRDGRLGLLLTVRRGWRPTQTHSRHYKCVERT